MKITGSSIVSLVLLAFFLYAVWEARDWPMTARLFPWVIAIAGAVLIGIQLVRDLTGWRGRRDGARSNVEMDDTGQSGLVLKVELQRTANFFTWLTLTVAAVWLVGFAIAMPAFVLSFMLIQGREGWVPTLLMTGTTVLFVVVLFEVILGIYWPQGYFLR